MQRIGSKREEALSAPGAALLLRRGLDAALGEPERGRDDLGAALAGFTAEGDAAGRLVAGAALVQLIGIADDDYTGFEDAVDAVIAARGALGAIDDPEHRLVAQTGLLVAGWFGALDDPLLPAQADAIVRALADETLHPAVRCCAGLTTLAFHVARFSLEGVLWVELAMRPVLAAPTLTLRLAEEWRHALLQGLYESGGAGRAEALRRGLDMSQPTPLPTIELKRLLAQAQNAIGEGRLDAGGAALLQAEPLLSPLAPRHASWWHLLRSRQELAAGRHRDAQMHAQLALRLVGESRLPERWTGVAVMQPGQVHVAAGHYAQAVPFFERAGAAAAGEQADFCWCLAHFARALDGFAPGGNADDAARAELEQGLALARRLSWLHFFRASPRVAAQLCALGLEHGIETAFVGEVIAARGLDAVRPDLSAWPWPIRIHTLGRLRIEIDGVALAFTGKVARKPLELLQFTIASGGSEVSAATVMFALWRELEGDKAKSAFNVALHRLRKLLGRDDAVVLEVGRLSLDPRQVWVDCLAFEHLVDGASAGPAVPISLGAVADLKRAVAIYGGHYLHDTDDEPWQLVYRARLASKFKRSVSLVVRHYIASGQPLHGRTLLERALELDPTAEDLTRELMQMLLEAGEQSEALRVFEQCRSAIERGLGAKPAASTLALLERARSGG
jgi:DNA-binding SARP family transcriptional activator